MGMEGVIECNIYKDFLLACFNISLQVMAGFFSLEEYFFFSNKIC